MARMLAAELGRDGYAVVSGLARGIDTAAHQGSLATGTVAVLAGGLDRPYPPENIDLLRRDRRARRRGHLGNAVRLGAARQGFSAPQPPIAGLSLGLVVVEAANRSGSLISARLAGEMGRLVFAVPGSPLDPRAAGTNGLLKDGAILVTEAARHHRRSSRRCSATPTCRRRKLWRSRRISSATPPPRDDDRARVIEALGPTPVGVDEIIRHTGLHPAQVFMILLELDLAGRLERHAGGCASPLAASSMP